MYGVKNTFGWAGLSAIFAAIITFIFAWLIPNISRSLETKKYPFYTCFILSILGAVASSLVFGMRPQVLSLLGVALILYIIRETQINDKSKIIYSLPVLFLFWANMHASFIMGLVLLGAYLALDKSLAYPAGRHPDAEWVKLYRPLSPETWKRFSQLSVLSAIATFINPYGARLYLEIIRTFSDNYGHNIIMEWLSPNFHSNTEMIFGFYLIFLFIILNITKKIDMFSFILLPFVLFLSLQSARNIPFFVLISLPVLIRSLEGFEDIFSSVVQKKFIALSLFALLIILPPYTNEMADVFKTMRDNKELAKFANFPQKEAIDFFRNYRLNNKNNNAFTDYLWGGYLISDIKCAPAADKKKELDCEPKVFVDGRMAHWMTPDRHILKDYVDITNLENNTKDVLEKYQIKVIFTNKSLLLGRSLASNNEWKKIYEDKTSVVYEKK
jgi:hypothetical protein